MAKRKAREDLGGPEPRKKAKKQAHVEAVPNAALRLAKPAKSASLLGLPAELRNTIWRFALVQEEAIKISPNSDAAQPGLLSVNRQIRQETRPIYCQENQVRVIIRNYKYAPHKGHWAWNRGNGEMAEVYQEGQNSWTNLKAWLRAYYDDGAKGLGQPVGYSSPDFYLTTEAFEVVDTLARAEVFWEVIEKILESMKKVATARPGSRWTD